MSERERARRGVSFAHLLAFVAVALPVVVSLRFSISTIDLAYLVRAGNVMLDTGHLLRTDLFTFTMHGEPWLNQQWGAEVLFALIHRAGGWEVLALVRAALVGVTFGCVWLACRSAGAAPQTAGWLTIASFLVSLDGLSLRPQLLGLALFALTLWVVTQRASRPRSIWLLPFIVALWANLHGSFVLAPLILVLVGLEDLVRGASTARRMFLVAVACGITALLNPLGPGVFSYVLSLTSNPDVRNAIAEWRPTTPLTPVGIGFFLSALGVLVIVIRARTPVAWPRAVGLLVFFTLGVTAIRGVFWWAIAAPVLVADLLPHRQDRPDEGRALNTAIAAVLTLTAVTLLPWFRPPFASNPNSARATDGLLAHSPDPFTSRVADIADPGARLFVPQLWSSWFEFAVPEDLVFVDPRIELFPSQVWHEYDVVSGGFDGWQDVLDRWGVDVLVLSRDQQSGLIARIEGAPGWDLAYEDPAGMILIRSP